MIKLSSNPILFKIEQINGDRFDTSTRASGVLGSAVHKALEVYYAGSDRLIPTNEQEAIEYGLKAGMEFLELYNDGFIEYQKNLPNKEALFQRMAFCFNAYVQQMPYRPDSIVSVEEKLSASIDVEWKDSRLVLPVPLKGRLDRIERTPEGKLRIVDYKTCYAFSNGDKIDGGKILQAVVYYLLAYATTGEEPYSVLFQEVKYTKNSDGSGQVREYEMIFAENELFFDFFFRFYEDMTRALNGEMVFLPNVHALFDNEVALIAYIHRLDDTEETAKLMKKHKVRNVTDLLKKQIQSAGNMRKLMKSVEEQFVSAKNLDYDKMKNEEKIQTKLIEHGMMLQFDSVVHGATVDLYRYTPSIGLKMSKLSGYVQDVEQVMGVSGIRILAPIPGTSFVGFEVPRAERSFPALPGADGYELAIGETLMGDVRRFDIRKAPHVLVAGASGSGKSVWLNATIAQLVGKGELYLFDPKIVELAQWKGQAARYESDADAITECLAELAVEMDERYKQLAERGLKNIDGTDIPYKFAIIDEFGDISAQSPEGTERWDLCDNHAHLHTKVEALVNTKRKLRVAEEEVMDELRACERRGGEKCCKHVVIPSFETSLLRLAAKGRAAGIHIIIATQSPRVEVIKGTIKANFPVKVVFKTAKAIDSMVVLDEPGAEKLAGMGDMLFAGDNGIERLQGYSV